MSDRSGGAGRGGPRAVGVDVGGTKLLAVAVSRSGEVETGSSQPAPRTPDDLVAGVRRAVELLAPAGPAAVGVGVPGLVDRADRVRFAPNLGGLAGADLRSALSSALATSCPVWVGNDATAACWAEHRMGAGAGIGHMVMVTLGTGIGGAIVAGGEVFEGSHRYAGEFGHMVVDPRGPDCGCGRRGCWEQLASGQALGRLARERVAGGKGSGRLLELAASGSAPVRGEDVTAAAAAGDRFACEVLEEHGWWVALGLANLANALDPEVIVVGGGLASAGEVVLEPVRRAFAGLVEAPEARGPLPIVAASLGPGAGAVGAALMALGRGGAGNGAN